MNTTAERLAGLRSEMAKAGVNGYLVPRAGAFLGEYFSKSEDRLLWISSFTGSYGMGVVLENKAAVFSDSRYAVQLKAELDRRFFQAAELVNANGAGVTRWIKSQTANDQLIIGYDPTLYSVALIKAFETEFEGTPIILRPVNGNLIDQIWFDRPASPHSGVEPFLETYAGMSSTQKRQIVADQLVKDGLAAAFLSDPADVAWLLNIRGRDDPHTPIAFSRAIIYADGQVEWVIDPMRVPIEIRRSLGNMVNLTPPEQIEDTVMRLKAKAGRMPVLIDERLTSYHMARLMEERNVLLKIGKSPVVIPRACKTMAEQASIRDAQRKDSAALVRFFSWLHDEAPRGMLDEMLISDKLIYFRKQDPAFRGTSFDSVVAFGANSALPHYRPSEKSNKRITGDGMLLIDSGGQYVGGTTDITRSVIIGTPTEDMCLYYTAVLRGHIAMATARFPKGTKGAQLDALGRAPVWQVGGDWRHAGHSVGCFLSVHEPGMIIGPPPRGLDDLMQGMYISNEPACYWEGEFGVRSENMMLVVPCDFEKPNGIFYELETVSLVPFDPALTNLSMLTHYEKKWLAHYHTRILDEIGPMVPPSDRAWLETVCKYFC